MAKKVITQTTSIDSNGSEPDDKALTLQQLLDAEKDVEVDDNLIPILEALDDELPPDFTVESVAAELLDQLSSYHRTKLLWRGARSSGDRSNADALYQQFARNRLTAALIQHEYPDAMKVAREIAKHRVVEVREQRAKLLRSEEEI